MTRREILKYTAYITGAAVSVPLATTFLSGCKGDSIIDQVDYQPVHFNKEQFSSLQQLIDIILPKTDSPSASEVGVHYMIDTMTECYDQEAKIKYQKKFEAFLAHLKEKAGETNFMELSKDEKIKILKELDTTDGDSLARAGYLELKQHTVTYYLNTEEIATTYLNYEPVPGEYIGCINLSDVNGKAWAL